MVKSRIWLSVYAVVLFFTVLSGDTLRYALTWYGWGAVVAVLFVISLVIVIRRRHEWRLIALPLPAARLRRADDRLDRLVRLPRSGPSPARSRPSRPSSARSPCR